MVELAERLGVPLRDFTCSVRYVGAFYGQDGNGARSKMNSDVWARTGTSNTAAATMARMMTSLYATSIRAPAVCGGQTGVRPQSDPIDSITPLLSAQDTFIYRGQSSPTS